MSDQGFGAFISYSRTVSTGLATDLQTELERFAKPWNRLRAMRVFRDDSTMSANASLWSAIKKGLADSRWLVLIATPEAAASEYVNKEVAWWVANKDRSRILVAYAGGEIAWDKSARDFTASSDAVPPALRGVFEDEPRWVDFRWYSAVGSLGKDDPRFADGVADLSATIREVERDSLVGENVRQHRLQRRWTRAALAGLSALLLASLVATSVAVVQYREAVQQRNVAEEQALVATVRQLAASAENLASTDLERALLLADTAYRTRQEPQTVGALHTVLSTTPQLVGFVDVGKPVTFVDGTPDGRFMVVGTTSGDVLLIDRDSGSRSELMQLPGQVGFLAISEDGATVAANWVQEDQPQQVGGSAVWRDGAVTEISERVVALSPSGHTIAFISDVETDSLLGEYAIGVISDGERREITTGGPALGWVELPDDSQIVAMNAHGGFTRAQLGGGAVERTNIPMGTWVAGGAVSQDGTRFTYSTGDGEIEVWDFNGPFSSSRYGDGQLSGLTGDPDFTDIALNSEGTLLATATPGSLYVSEVQSIASHTTGFVELKGAGDRPHSLRFIADHLLVSAAKSSVALWDLTRTEPLVTSTIRPLAGLNRGCSACGPLEVTVAPNGSEVVVGYRAFPHTVADLATGYSRTIPIYPRSTDPSDSVLEQASGSAWLDDERALVWSDNDRGWVLGGENLSVVEDTLSLPSSSVVVRDDGVIVMLADGSVRTMETGSWEVGDWSAPADVITADGVFALQITPAEDAAFTDVEIVDTRSFRQTAATRVDGRLHSIAAHTGADTIALMRSVDDDAGTELLSLDLSSGAVTTIGRLGLGGLEYKSVASSNTRLAVEEAGRIWLYSLHDASRLSLVRVQSGYRTWNSLGFNRDGSTLVIASEPANEILQVPVTSEEWSRMVCRMAGRSATEDEIRGTVDSTHRLVFGCSAVSDNTTDGHVEPSTELEPTIETALPQPSASVDETLNGESSSWDVSGFKKVQFASPSGEIVCGIEKGKATCGLPDAMPTDERPDSAYACPNVKDSSGVAGRIFGAAGVSVESEVRWACAGGILFWPVEGQSGTEWATQYPAGRSSSGDGRPSFVTLPYGASVRNAGHLCTSREDGMTCENTSTGAGVTVSSRGVSTNDGAAPLPGGPL